MFYRDHCPWKQLKSWLKQKFCDHEFPTTREENTMWLTIKNDALCKKCEVTYGDYLK